ncbi:hypothetical protein ACS0TY_004979 [Phlomoides rotata]
MAALAAGATISLALEKLGEALINKVKFLGSVADQVEWLKDELEYMRYFLQDAEMKRGNDALVSKIDDRRTKMAKDVVKAMEVFTNKTCTGLGKWVCFHTIGKEIESILKRLDEITKRRLRYGIRNLWEVGTKL